MRTKTLQQTVKFKASPREVYNMLMDTKKHQSLSGQPAKMSRKVGGGFTAWDSHISYHFHITLNGRYMERT